MDMRQAAKYFKDRWQWRTEAASVRERYVQEAEARKQEVAARKQAATMAANGGAIPQQTTEKKPVERRDPIEQAVEQDDQDQPVKNQTRKERAEIERQKILAVYVNSVVEMLEQFSPVGTPREAETVAALSAALSLLDTHVSPEALLELSKKVKAATGDDQRKKFFEEGGLTTRQASYWMLIEDEVKHLEKMQGKGDKLEWSSKFASDSVSIIEAFLGPAGPMFKTARDLYSEYKDSFKKIKAGWSRMSKWILDRKAILTKNWVRSRIFSGRMFSKLGALFKKMSGMGSRLWKGAASAVGRFAKPLLLLAAGVTAAITAFAFKDDITEKVGQASDWISSKYDGVKRRVKKAFSKVKTFIDASPVLQRVKGLVAKTAGSIAEMHSQAVDWVSQKSSNIAAVLTNKYTEAMEGYEELKASFLDSIGSVKNVTSGVFSKMVDFFEDVWSRIKKLVPNWLRRAYNKAKAAINSPAKASSTGAAGMTSDPKGGDGVADTKAGAPSAAESVKSPSTKVNSGSVRGVSLAGVNPTVQQNFLAMTTEFESLTGSKVQVNSGKRSTADQERLYRTMPHKAAKPGYSMHEFGLAIDANSAEVNKMDSMGLMAKYGFARPVPGEPWHIEPVSIQKYKKQIRAAKDGEEEAKAIDVAVGGSVNTGADTEGVAQVTPVPDSPVATSEASTTVAISEAPTTVASKDPSDKVVNATLGPSAVAASKPVYEQLAKNQKQMMAPAKSAADTDPAESMNKQVMASLGSMGGSVGKMASFGADMTGKIMSEVGKLGSTKDIEGDMTSKVMLALAQAQSDAGNAKVRNEPAPAPDMVAQEKSSMSVAPAIDTQYKRVESKSKGARVSPQEETAKKAPEQYISGSNVQTSANSVSLWLGDPGMLTLNLGIGA